ncbi:SDR family oxidoreductase [Sinomicrobium oceani]|uniref:SDR family oxidoreductase n=1 Tax=Sinomicrobium oceani TaxID=1150368 RepID=UPI00227BEEA4|nr:NAD(P)H-binding protein [Sinomicrobium oceani]
MAGILITGGTGTLGKKLCQLLDARRTSYIIGTRKECNDPAKVTMDLIQNTGVREAVAGKELIFHLATDMKKDTEATQNLLKALGGQSKVHLVYISIVGIEDIPFSYYRQKLASENAIKQSGIPYTIVRATQFHEFAHSIITNLLRYRIGILPKKIVLQTIDVSLVAKELVNVSQKTPENKTYELGGAEILKLGQMAAIWLKVTGKRRWILNIPIPGKLGKALRNGALTTRYRKKESSGFQQWLANYLQIAE